MSGGRKSTTSRNRGTSRSKSKASKDEVDFETEKVIKQLELEIKEMHDSELRKGLTLERLKLKVKETQISLQTLQLEKDKN